MNISGLFRARFVHYEDYIYENFKALRLNLNEQRANEKKPSSIFFFIELL